MKLFFTFYEIILAPFFVLVKPGSEFSENYHIAFSRIFAVFDMAKLQNYIIMQFDMLALPIICFVVNTKENLSAGLVKLFG